MAGKYETRRYVNEHGIWCIEVSPDFKIEEALRGMSRCLERVANPDYPLGWCEARETVEENLAHAATWQAIAIAWASR